MRKESIHKTTVYQKDKSNKHIIPNSTKNTLLISHKDRQLNWRDKKKVKSIIIRETLPCGEKPQPRQ